MWIWLSMSQLVEHFLNFFLSSGKLACDIFWLHNQNQETLRTRTEMLKFKQYLTLNLTSFIFLTSSHSRIVALYFPILLTSSRLSSVVRRIKGTEREKVKKETTGKVWKQVGTISQLKLRIKSFSMLMVESVLPNEKIQKFRFFPTDLFLRKVLVSTINASLSNFRLKIYTQYMFLPHSLGGEPVASSCSSSTTTHCPWRNTQNNKTTSADWSFQPQLFIKHLLKTLNTFTKFIGSVLFQSVDNMRHSFR